MILPWEPADDKRNTKSKEKEDPGIRDIFSFPMMLDVMDMIRGQHQVSRMRS
jgi:hypothetical protein